MDFEDKFLAFVVATVVAGMGYCMYMIIEYGV